jgi:hypothetical protein
MLVARVLALSGVIGCGAGWLMPMIKIPFLSCVVCYFLGLFSGRWLKQFIDRSIENNATKIIVFGILIGFSLSPLSSMPFALFEVLRVSIMGGSQIFDALTLIVSVLFSPIGFIVGMLRATVWGERF